MIQSIDMLQQVKQVFDTIPLCYFPDKPEFKRLNSDKFFSIITGVDSALVNFVYPIVDKESITATDIEQLINSYQQENKNFTLFIGEDYLERLPPILLSQGFSSIGTFDGLILNLANADHNYSADVEFCLANEFASENRDMFIELFAQAFGIDPAGAEFYCDHFYLNNQTPYNMEVYLALDKTTNKAVAFGGLSQLPGLQIGLLNGAATLAEYRGHNIYKALLSLRIQRAKELGYTDLVLQANSETSSPICQRNGFNKFYQQQAFSFSVN